jgi:tRNA (guanine37-N1)-methyltransferase
VPEVLSSGNHEQIRRWRRRRALEKTIRNRPELVKPEVLSREDREIIAELRQNQRES